ncbi:MAG: type II toxin-antitoxin system RelE/ParE family toxin [Crocinitomicaceae bacterium]|nr:type II toxin-antitoxin system RelE/ParE family toxin [Crocinitomicaceae bacterium]
MTKYEVRLSPIAEIKLKKIADYILEEFGLKSREKFLKIFTEHVRKLETHPETGVESKLIKELRKNVVSKQTSFYYRIKGNQVFFLTVSDNRQDPKKLMKEIKKLALTQ